MKYRTATREQFSLPAEAVQTVRGKIKELRIAAIGDLLHRRRLGNAPELNLSLNQLRLDPMTFVTLVPFVVRKIIGAGQ